MFNSCGGITLALLMLCDNSLYDTNCLYGEEFTWFSEFPLGRYGKTFFKCNNRSILALGQTKPMDYRCLQMLQHI